MNNLAFALIMCGDSVVAREWIGRAKSLLSGVDDQQKAILQATEGLLLYRDGNPEEGARHYIATILKARELKNEKLLQLAYLHFCYEELRIGHATPFWSTEELKKFFESDDVSKDAKAVFKRMLLPMLIAREKYGLIDAGFGTPLPISLPKPL